MRPTCRPVVVSNIFEGRIYFCLEALYLEGAGMIVRPSSVCVVSLENVLANLVNISHILSRFRM